MDYKEKLRLAKEALDSGSYDKETIEYIFPELKESEDEKVRKCLIAIITDFDSLYLQENYSLSREDALAWIEKQGEKKPILDVEIPFGAKDSELEEVSYNIPNGYHAEIEDNKVVIKKGEQKRQMPLVKSVSTDFKDRLGTLMHYTSVDLEKEENKQLLNEAAKELLQLAYSDKANEIALASAKTWEEGMAILMAANKAYRRGQKEQRSASWGEEDKAMLNLIIARLHSHPNVDLEEYSKEYEWLKNKLKSLRPQSQWKPSDEQMEALNNIKVTGCISYAGQGQELDNLYQDLNKLREE